jgi:hypothetical protein
MIITTAHQPITDTGTHAAGNVFNPALALSERVMKH